MFDIIGKRRYAYVLSAVLVTIGLLAVFATLIPNGNVGLQFSIAYTGGTVWEVHFEDGTPDPVEVRDVLDELELSGSEVAITGESDRQYVLVRTEALDLVAPQVLAGSAAAALAASPSPAASAAAAASGEPGATSSAATSAPASLEPRASDNVAASLVPIASVGPDTSAAPDASVEPDGSLGPDASVAPDPGSSGDIGPVSGVPTEGQFGALASALQERFGRIDEVRQANSVGPVVSSELIQQTFLLIIFAALAIMAWVSYRFRDVRMGVTAIIALLHDVVIVVGAFALLGTATGLQVDALFVTAMLTVIGFSVHDTIVVFDRVRENRHRYLGEPMEEIVGFSLGQTVGRSLTTSLTLVLTLLALLVFGGEAIRPFTLALLIGVIAGTYSSVFVATPLFLDWHRYDDRRKARREALPNRA